MKCGVLKNKWKYILYPNNCLQTITILILVRAGSIYEPSGQRGLSHFIEHLFFQGTHGKLKNTKDITSTIYLHGGYINAFTSYDYTGYYIKIDAQHLEEAMKVLSEMFFLSKFASDAIKKEKKIVIQENKRHSSEPYRLLQEINYQLLFDKTPLAENIGGTESEINNFTKDNIYRYLNSHYQDVVVSLAGKMNNQTRIITLLNKYFGKKLKYGNGKTLKNKNNLSPPIYTQPKLKSISRNFEESYISMGFPVCGLVKHINNFKERAICDILGIILGGNMTSRLFNKLRENNQYVYTVQYYINHYEIGGELSFHCGTQPKYITNVVKEMFQIFHNFKATQKELEEAISYRIGELLLKTEDSSQVAEFQAYHYLIFDKCWTIDDQIKIYQKIKLKDVNLMAKNIFDLNKVNLCIIN